MIADLGTKTSLSTKQFIFLRDVMNGYALVRASRVGKQQPEVAMSCMVISTEELMKGAKIKIASSAKKRRRCK
jgi:hypothetical protein